MRESIEGRETGSQQLDDAEKSLVNEMCNVSVSWLIYLWCIIDLECWLIQWNYANIFRPDKTELIVPV